MSNRGNQDHFKIQGTRTHDTDLAGMAHRHFAQQRAEERRRQHVPTGPQAAPVHVHAPDELKPLPPEEHAEAPSSEAAPRGHEQAAATSAWRRPSVGQAARVVVGGAWKLAGWAAVTTWRLGQQVIEKRLEHARSFGRRVEQRAADALADAGERVRRSTAKPHASD